jgi:uncharacterized protein
MRLVAFFLILQIFVLNASGQDSLAFSVFSIGQKIQFHSAVLEETRILNVYLPVSYHTNDTIRYQVVYLMDGSAEEDFLHVAGMVQYLSFPWIAQCENTIVVGIENIDRRRDFTFPTKNEEDLATWPTTGGSSSFISFLAEEVLPLIDRTYRTDYRKIFLGQSLGGLLGCQIILDRPGLFSDYLIVSPSLWWDDGSLIERFRDLPLNANLPSSVHIAIGEEGRIMVGDAKTFHRILCRKTKRVPRPKLQRIKDRDHSDIGHEAMKVLLESLHRHHNRRSKF